MSLFRRGLPSDRLSAADWIIRLNSGDRTSEEEQAFRVWLEANPENRVEFERLTDIWDIVPSSAPQLARSAPIEAAAGRTITRRHALVAGGGAVAAALAGGLAVQPAMAVMVYETRVGERQRLRLSDGSGLLIDADSRVQFRDNLLQRDLWLDRGRISLEIARSRVPFHIDTGAGELIAREGQFDLSRLPRERSEFVALRGDAIVRITGTEHSLPTGKRLRRLQPDEIVVDQPEPAVASAWKSGRIVIENEKLADIVDEANRYGPVRLALADEDVAARRISGIYRLGENRALAGSLGEMLSLELTEGPGTITLSAPR